VKAESRTEFRHLPFWAESNYETFNRRNRGPTVIRVKHLTYNKQIFHGGQISQGVTNLPGSHSERERERAPGKGVQRTHRNQHRQIAREHSWFVRVKQYEHMYWWSQKCLASVSLTYSQFHRKWYGSIGHIRLPDSFIGATTWPAFIWKEGFVFISGRLHAEQTAKCNAERDCGSWVQNTPEDCVISLNARAAAQDDNSADGNRSRVRSGLLNEIDVQSTGHCSHKQSTRTKQASDAAALIRPRRSHRTARAACWVALCQAFAAASVPTACHPQRLRTSTSHCYRDYSAMLKLWPR